MKELLISLNACGYAKEWAADKSWQEIYDTCDRGDWLLWLFYHTNGDRKLLTLAKGHCANTVRHLMKDERSIKAVNIAIAYGEGRATKEELAAAASYAASDAASYAAAAAYAAAYAASYAASDAASYAASDAASDAARKANQRLTADICRKYLPIEIWNISPEGTLINQ